MKYTKSQIRRAYGKGCVNSPIAPYAYRIQKNGQIYLYHKGQFCGYLPAKVCNNRHVDLAGLIQDAISRN